MPDSIIGEHSRQWIFEVVKAVSFSIDYVLLITKKSISPHARAKLTVMMLDRLWEADSQQVQQRAIELLMDKENGDMENNNNIMELFKNSVTPLPAAPVFNIEFRDNQIENVIVTQLPSDGDKIRDD